jgi:undecaprenyl-diphosphatase
MITVLQAIILGLVQGASELFPISSLAHGVIIPALFGWNITENDNSFVIFLVATHFATACALLVFYWRTWVEIIKGMGRSLRDRQIKAADSPAKLGWLLVVGTIPAGIIGLLFQDQIRAIFVSPKSAAFFLMINGFVLLGAEYLRRRSRTDAPGKSMERNLARVSWGQATGIGSAQTLALIPGFSRTGTSLAGGLLARLTHEDAANFAFLLATPIIFAAALLKLPELAAASNKALVVPSVVGGLCAALTAYLSVRFLTRYFKTNSLKPFGIYCLVVGALATLFFMR